MGIEVAMQEPPAIVAQAESSSDWMKLPGIEEFATALKDAVRDAREKSALGRVLSWEIIRQCYEYGSRPEVQTRVAVMNRLPDGSFRRGRPFAGHRLAMNAIAAKCAVRLRTVEKWQTSFNEAVKYGDLVPKYLNELRSDKSAGLANRLEEIEAKVETRREEGTLAAEREQAAHASERLLPPEAYGEFLAQVVVRRAKLEEALNPPVVRGLVSALCPILERHGYRVMLRKRSSA
jgi:hypothetical protein